MYAEGNPKTKKEFKERVNNGEQVRLFAPGFGSPVYNGKEYVEGPHAPQPHRWYATVQVKEGFVVNVK